MERLYQDPLRDIAASAGGERIAAVPQQRHAITRVRHELRRRKLTISSIEY